MKKKSIILFVLFLAFTIFYIIIFPSKFKSNFIVSEKSDTSTNTYSIYENWENYFKTTATPSPTPPITITVSNVDELCKSDVSIGEIVQTLGYYSSNDGGGATYKIVNKTSDTITYNLIPLHNDLYASLIPSNNTASAKQFGAKGNGTTDDSAALNTAFNSGISSITLEEGNYLCLQPIDISTNNLNISGTDAILFTNNNYRKGETTNYSAFFNIFSSSNISMSGVTIEAHETKKVGYIVQFSIRYAENITFDHCSFIIPDTVLSKESIEIKTKSTYCNGDVFTSWKNISITNCTFIQLSDTDYGGLIGFRDIYKKNCDTALFENNNCIYNGHDEMIAVVSSTDSTVKNVTIQNNNLTVLPGKNSSPRSMCFTIGYDDNYIVNNIVFKNNTIDAYSDFAFMTFGNASNVSILKNTIKFHSVTPSAAPNLFYCTKPTAESNITIDSNTITCDDTGSITSFSYGSFYIKNNTIISNLAVTSAFFYQTISVTNNTITFNKTVKMLTNDVLHISDNIINFNDKISHIYQFYNTIFSKEHVIDHNTLNFNAIQDDSCTFLMLNGTTLNNYKLTVRNNKNTFLTNDTTDKTLYMLSLNDTTRQTIEIKNNQLGNFLNTYNYTSTQIEQNIDFKNNN